MYSGKKGLKWLKTTVISSPQARNAKNQLRRFKRELNPFVFTDMVVISLPSVSLINGCIIALPAGGFG
jgi:hypothetical protein